MEVFLYFFEAKHSGRQLWVYLNGVAGRGLLTFFQSSYKNVDPADNSSVEELPRRFLAPPMATVLSARVHLESLGTSNATCKTHRRRL